MKRLLILTTLLILTACAAPTATAAPSNTPEPTTPPSTLPLSESTRIPTPDLSLPSGGVEQLSFPFIAINKIDIPTPEALLLYDLSTGGVRKIKLDDYYGAPQALGWADNGCKIIVSGARETGKNSWKWEIALIDLQGSKRTRLFTTNKGLGLVEGEYKIYETLSPAADYLAYLVSNGEFSVRDSFYEVQRAYVISLKKNNTIPVELTSNDKVIYLQWSPSGDRLAFTTKDEDGQLGLYVIKPDNTEKTPIIDLTSPVSSLGLKVGYPMWSPQGDAIAVVDWIEQSPENYQYVIRIVSPTGGELHQIPVEVPPYLISWSEDGRQIVFRAARDLVDNEFQPHIFWLDIASGEVVHTLRQDEVEEGYRISWVYSTNYAEELLLTGGRIKSAYLYNRLSQSLTPLSPRHIDDGSSYSSFLISPPDFPGEENCR